MREIIGLVSLFSLVACGDKTQGTNSTIVDTVPKVTETKKGKIVLTVSNICGFDTSYDISTKHQPFLLTRFFDRDNTLDTAIIVRHKSTGKDALFIKHSGTDQNYLLRNGKDVGRDFDDFNWIGQFEVIKKGTKVWDNVIDGEIVGEDQIPDNKKIALKSDAIFIHEDEGGGGGIIYFKNGKYVWVQQD